MIRQSSLNIESADFLILLGQTIEAKIQVVDCTQKPSIQKQQQLQQEQIKEPQKEFNLQDCLSTIEVKVVQSLYTSPSSELQNLKCIQDQEQNKAEENQDEEISSVSFNKEQQNNQQNPKENAQKTRNNKQYRQNDSNQRTDIFQGYDFEQQTETLSQNLKQTLSVSHGTPDFNKNSKSKKEVENKTKQKKKQSTLEYLILPQHKDRESSPKRKSHHKLTKEIKKESNRMSQRKCSRWKFYIAFSGFHPSREEQQFLLIQSIQICLEDYTFNLLIMEDNVQLRSIKLLIALEKKIFRLFRTLSLKKFRNNLM